LKYAKQLFIATNPKSLIVNFLRDVKRLKVERIMRLPGFTAEQSLDTNRLQRIASYNIEFHAKEILMPAFDGLDECINYCMAEYGEYNFCVNKCAPRAMAGRPLPKEPRPSLPEWSYWPFR
jgi:hypothetical protein